MKSLFERGVRLKPRQVLQAAQETALFDQRLQELLLGIEMIVDRGIRDSRLPCDIAHGRPGETPLRKEGQRRVADLLPCVRTATARPGGAQVGSACGRCEVRNPCTKVLSTGQDERS